MSNQPRIRFKQYTSDWEQRKLGEVAKIIMGQSPDGSTYSETPSDYILVQGNADLKDGWVSPRIWTTQKTKTADAGDLIMSVRAPAGAMGKTAYDVVLGRGVAGIKGNEFLFQSLVRMDGNGYWKKLSAGSTFESINSDAINNAVISIPQDIDEQGRIGDYLQGLDNLITLHQRKLTKYKNIRSCFLQEMFCTSSSQNPNIRFPEYTGAWEKMPLSKIMVSYTDYLPTPTDGYTRLGIRSHMKGTFYEYVAPNKRLGEKRLQRVKRDNFIVNIVFAWEHAIAVTTEEDEGKLVSHRFPQFSFTEGMHPRFFHYAFHDERFRHHLWLASPSGAGRNKTLRIDEMMEYKLRVPEYAEQKKIADFLTSLDELIELYDYRITKLQNIKSACLQGMFV